MRINSSHSKDFDLYSLIAMSNPNNPYLQNFSAHFRLADNTSCTICERLFPYDHSGIPNREKRKALRMYKVFSQIMTDKGYSKVKTMLNEDAYLKEALINIFSSLKNAHEQDERFIPILDIHRGNIMFRDTDSGWQMVLSDPLEYSTVRLRPPEYSEEFNDECILYPRVEELLLMRMLGLQDDYKIILDRSTNNHFVVK